MEGLLPFTLIYYILWLQFYMHDKAKLQAIGGRKATVLWHIESC